MKRTYQCEYCGKKDMKSPMEKALHVQHCKAAIQAKEGKKKGRKPQKDKKVRTGKKFLRPSQNIQYVPMVLALNFTDQTFEIMGTQQIGLS